MQSVIGKRLKAAREKAGLTQQQLSSRLGFKDRQTLAAIESGNRKLSADELLLAMQALNRDLEYFTDPFRLDGEGSFTWRTSAENVEVNDDFESRAGRWLALYRNVAKQKDVWTSPLRLALTTRSSYEQAHRAGEWLVNEWELGEIPAIKLEKAISERLRALVLYIDPPEGISGAAFKLPELSAILINRNDVAGRRSFDLAHELFHLLTWDTIKPDYSEYRDEQNKSKRSETLANCFASALLMPEDIIRTWWAQAPEEDETGWRSWVSDLAKKLHVTSSALLWRFVQLGMIEKKSAEESEEWSEVNEIEEDKPPMFSLDFVKTLSHGLEEGRISVRRAAASIDLSVDDLADLFREHSLEVPFDI
ncbi:MAG: helix-turn-helix domain-containing protein [Candidatus Latescibacteria bacterium]|nr:helix-turn-helix domain-containing protein [Candidatus Latescibacterota bacterium]NIM64491.1 helix-turn-helix domain-containing protein [Candidatus Latescibacterota bacterium]NIO00644.1 helix-turn-helix domain-containing protein [Candidatus Latescibacterota bacterium]NIO27047.1 helix-turn-helix domain-containing protein [Candidatus Latescibacterota bacterium]NIO54571.1 helix-turn-helix domain-containing protein [Candidatus Latescibacterota bacterium]